MDFCVNSTQTLIRSLQQNLVSYHPIWPLALVRLALIVGDIREIVETNIEKIYIY